MHDPFYQLISVELLVQGPVCLGGLAGMNARNGYQHKPLYSIMYQEHQEIEMAGKKGGSK